MRGAVTVASQYLFDYEGDYATVRFLRRLNLRQ